MTELKRKLNMSESLIFDLLQNITESIKLVEERFIDISKEEDFVSTSEGVTTLDAIAMRLQFIGESLKKIEKIDNSVFNQYPEIEWKQIIQLRNFISHHYEMLNHEIIFDICKNHIPLLKATIEKWLNK